MVTNKANKRRCHSPDASKL
ncbi:hypothetical protein NDA10_000870, partial [Ustilago hordei]